MQRYGAEFFGTFWLVLGGCGSAVLAAAFPEVGIGLLGVSLAFGLTVLTMAFAIGHISGCHLNPAVSVGLWAAGRFPKQDLLPYIAAQVLGGIAAGGVLLPHCQRQGGLRPVRGLRFERLRRSFAGRVQLHGGARHRSRHDHDVSAGHSGCHRQTRASGVCANRDRALPDPHPSDQHSGHEHVRESCTQHGRRGIRRRLGGRTALAVLAGPDRWWRAWCGDLSGHWW